MIRPNQSASEGGANVGGDVGGSVIIGYTIAEHEAALARHEARIRTDLERAHAAEKALLQRELDEVRRQRADPDASFETRRAELTDAETALRELADGLPQGRLDAALAALAEGDTGKAEALFAQVQAMEATGIARAARAAHERGKLAEADIRWADAARNHAEAARLDPSFDHLFAARKLAWRAGDYRSSLIFGEDLVQAAVAEHGQGSADHAAALNEHGLTLQATGRYAEAEPLYRQSLAIDEKALGAEHPDYATRLNNLAGLLEDTGRHAEAEPLYRQALAIDEKALGAEHPDYAIDLNNLAGLLQATGRHAEAEPLYRQALAIGEKTLGAEHPDYATRLSNLAGLLEDTGRHAEAEPLYRQALAIGEKTLGVEHPDYAVWLNNLAGLLQATGRHAEAEPLCRQALAIFTKAFGADHPSTRTVASNLAALEADESPRRD